VAKVQLLRPKQRARIPASSIIGSVTLVSINRGGDEMKLGICSADTCLIISDAVYHVSTTTSYPEYGLNITNLSIPLHPTKQRGIHEIRKSLEQWFSEQGSLD
jgi:hypothetical protein